MLSDIIFANIPDDFLLDEFYKRFNLITASENKIPTRHRCPKCAIKNPNKAKVFLTCDGVIRHLQRQHREDEYEFPTIQQSLKLIEIHSINLQIKVFGENI